jgi:FO synthase subunit 1
VVGYSLGNRNDQENEIQVLGEDDPNVLTYSKALPIILTRMCRNECPYCAFNRKDNLVVPYSTIRQAKNARAQGAREAFYMAGERPDKYSHVRATLDLWGFPTYIDYLYTVCELGFLEGLIPVIELGFMTPQELKKISEITALVKIMLDSVDSKLEKKVYAKSPGKRLKLRSKSVEWCGKLNIPVSTGIIVGIGESKGHHKEALQTIADLHNEYGHIHEVLIQNFVPQPKTAFEKKEAPNQKQMLETVELAKSILPNDVSVIVPIEQNPDIEPFIKLGIRDIGRLIVGKRGVISKKAEITASQI